ncbi:MAG: folylpolyglutamate synthase/dihydrofolate synthase family protein [Acidaminococcaceae bacterium]
MNYTETLAYLDSLGKFGINLGMERIEDLLKELDNPEPKSQDNSCHWYQWQRLSNQYDYQYLIGERLKSRKILPSPHLVRYNERIEVDGEEISDEDFALVVTAVRRAVESVMAKGTDQPTQFEVLTAAAFLHFALQKLDYAVIEVGLGGLWDSTNVITPVVSVITNVSLDHTDRCGKTVEEIAMQKAGIIKDGVPVVTAAEGEALGPIQAMSLFKQAPLYIYGKAFTGQEVSSSMEGQTFTLSAGDYHSNYDVKLPGAHQILNTAVAVVAAKLASKQDSRINELALHQGVALTKWPGRLERISQKPDVILDGAHNPAGAAVLRAALDKYYSGKKICFIFGMMGDKDTSQVITTLFRKEDTIYTVRADEGARAAEPEALAEQIGHKAKAMHDLSAAYKTALAEVGEDGLVCVCGSLYLVGTFKKMLLNQ